MTNEIKKVLRKALAKRKKEYGENWYDKVITEKALKKINEELCK